MSDALIQAVESVFQYPTSPSGRRHGPRGYTSYQSYKPWLRDEFSFRCVYCLCRERWEPNGAESFSVEHVVTQSSDPSQARDYANLVYACCICNSSRADAPLPFHPSHVSLRDHLQLLPNGTMRSSTDEGAALIEICRLNRASLVSFRQRLLHVIAALAAHRDHPPARSALREMLGFPEDLPKLAGRRPPDGNARPQGIAESYFEQHNRGELPEFY